MTRRQALSAAAAAPAILNGAGRPAGDKPNLLVIWTDQQRADTMAAYGNTRFRVPNMNRLAAESVVFDRCYVTQPVCTPSRSSVLTGLWPHQNGCVRNNIPLTKSAPTWPERLNDSSYRTGYFGKWHLGDEIFAQRGFQEWAAIEDGIYQEYYSEGRDKNARSAYHNFLVSLGYKPGDPKRPNSFTRDQATQVPVEHSKPSFLAQEASRFILKNRHDPWMLSVNFLEPHTPFFSALDGLYTDEECPMPANFDSVPKGEPEWYGRRRARFARRAEGFDLSSPDGWRKAHRHYAGLCSLVDQAVGRILWALEASGVAENTAVLYTSDHGEMMGAHRLLTKSVMYEESVRVPFLLRAPFRRLKPGRVNAPVSHIDLAPTVFELLGRKELADGLPGESHLTRLTGARRRDDHVYLEWNAAPGNDEESSARTVISPDGFKLVLHEKDRPLLLNRLRDPLETTNLLPDEATVSKLRKKLDGWQHRTADRVMVAR